MEMKRIDWLAIGIVGFLFVYIGQLIGSQTVLVVYYKTVFPNDNVPFSFYITPYTLLGTIISGTGLTVGFLGFIKLGLARKKNTPGILPPSPF